MDQSRRGDERETGFDWKGEWRRVMRQSERLARDREGNQVIAWLAGVICKGARES